MPIAEDLALQVKILEAGWKTAHIERPLAWHQHWYDSRSAFKRAYNEGHAARLLGVRYGALDAIADAVRPDIWLTLARQVRYGRARHAVDFLYPCLRPVALWTGHRFGRRLWR